MQYPATAEVIFKGDTLTTIQDGRIKFVAMKPIVEAIGLDWKSQHRKLMSQKDKFSCGHMTILNRPDNPGDYTLRQRGKQDDQKYTFFP